MAISDEFRKVSISSKPKTFWDGFNRGRWPPDQKFRVRGGGDDVSKQRRQGEIRPITKTEDSTSEAHPGDAGCNQQSDGDCRSSCRGTSLTIESRSRSLMLKR